MIWPGWRRQSKGPLNRLSSRCDTGFYPGVPETTLATARTALTSKAAGTLKAALTNPTAAEIQRALQQAQNSGVDEAALAEGRIAFKGAAAAALGRL